MTTSDVVGRWSVTLPDGVHCVEVEHGKTSGKRVVRVNGKEVLRKNWMIRLTGIETVDVGVSCTVTCNVLFGYRNTDHFYALSVDGLPLDDFNASQQKAMTSWDWPDPDCGGQTIRINIVKSTLDIWVGPVRATTTAEFVEDGTQTHFTVGCGQVPAYIKTESTGRRRTGIVHRLFINDVEISPIDSPID